MKPLKGQNSDLLAMLSGKAAGAKGAGKAAGEGADLLAMLGGSTKTDKAGALGGLSKSEFAEILSQKGMLEDISAEDLMNFFKKSQGAQGEPVAQLLQQYSQMTGKSVDLDALPAEVKGELQELSFDGAEFTKPNGEVVPKNQVIKLLSKIEGQSSDQFGANLKNTKLMSGSNRLAEMPKGQTAQKIDKKAMLGKTNASDFVDHKMALAKNTSHANQVQGPKNNPALNQYNKENHKLNKSLIQTKKPFGELGKVSSSKNQHKIETNEKLDNTSLDSVDMNSMDTLTMADLKGHSADKQGFQSHSGQGAQTLDLSNISANNKAELMQKVGNYIEQSYVSGKGSVDMVVNHEELGQFRIQAHKVGNNGQVNLEINTITDKGHQFFADNQVELLKTLDKSGIKLHDFKITPQSDFLSFGDSKSAMNFDSSSSSFFGGGDRGEGSAFTQSGRQGDNRGEDRRRQLWQEAKTFSEQMYA